MERIAGNRYRFDALGNLVERIGADGERLRLAYDGAQRLVHLTRDYADGTRLEARYRYDALSRRIAKVVLRDGVEQQVRFGWDGDRQCTEAFARELRTTVHEPGGFVPLLRLEQACEPDPRSCCNCARRSPPKASRCRRNACRRWARRGSLSSTPITSVPPATERRTWPTALAGRSGRLAGGGAGTTAGCAADPLPGQYHDEESGLYYNRYRYYLPEAGRYASQDPLGLGGGPNPMPTR